MAIFEAGDIVKSNIGMPIKIVKFLDAGGQGEVYVVEYIGKKKALKWYTNVGNNSQAVYAQMKHNVVHGSPHNAFLWPEAITEEPNDFVNISGKNSFGIVIDFVPDGFISMYDYLVYKFSYNNMKCAIDVSIKILEAFQRLHLSGYCFNGLNDGDFFINLETHDVLISGTENIAPIGFDLGLMFMPRYSAPEIVAADSRCSQTVYTSRYSLYVILFMLLFGTHPLEGKKWLVPCLSYKDMQELYGFNPVFIMDKEDDSNRPDWDIHKHFIEMWNSVPKYIRELYLKVFSKESLLNPTQRCHESELLKVYCRFKNDIIESE